MIAPNTNVLALGINPHAFSGSVWNGRAHLSFRHIEGVLGWDLGIGSIFVGSLPVDLELKSTAGDFSASLDLGLMQQSLKVDSMRLDIAKLNPFVRVHRVTLAGDVFVKDLSLDINSRVVEQISGRFNWSGGAVAYPAGREIHNRTLARFTGKINTDQSGNIKLGVRDEGASFDVLKGSWDAQGVALWEVTRRMLDLADEPWAQNSQETDVVFKVKKAIPRDLSKS